LKGLGKAWLKERKGKELKEENLEKMHKIAGKRIRDIRY